MGGEKKIKKSNKKTTPKRIIKSVSKRSPTSRSGVILKSRPKSKPVSTPVLTEQPAATAVPNRETVLPTPLHVEPDHIITSLGKSKTAPHRWSLCHNFFTILILVCVGSFTLAVVAGYADVTIRLINAYGTQTSINMYPLSTTERPFPTIGGNLTMLFPERWQVTTTAEDTILWELIDHPEQHITLHIDTTEAENIFTWLQQQQPTYRQAQVIAPTEAVQALRGIMVEATGENNEHIQTVYFPQQKDLANKYIVSLTLDVPADDVLLERSLADFSVFVNNLRFP